MAVAVAVAVDVDVDVDADGDGAGAAVEGEPPRARALLRTPFIVEVVTIILSSNSHTARGLWRSA